MTTITIIGNAVGDPEIRFTPAGKPCTSFTVADNHRKKDGDQWVDDGATFYKVSCWRDAEAIANEVTKGKRVIVTGDLRNKPWEDRQGAKRDSLEVNASVVGLVIRESRQQPRQDTQQGWGGQHSGGTPSQAWGVPQGQSMGKPQTGADPWSQGGDAPAPF